MRRLLQRLGAPDPAVLTRLEEGWEGALGAAAPHARVFSLTAGELVVEADHPAWATRVEMARGRLQDLAGEPLHVVVRVRR